MRHSLTLTVTILVLAATVGAGGSVAAGVGTAVSADASPTDTPTTTPSSESATPQWPSTVPADVIDRFDDADRVSVVLTLDSTADLDAMAERLRAAGAADVSVRTDGHRVAATVNQSALRTAAADDTVRAVRYDGSVSTDGPSATATASGPVTGDGPTEPTAASPTSPSTATTAFTATEFAVFGEPVIPLGVVALCAALWAVRRRR